MMPRRASMEDPMSQSKNLHHRHASATEEMREQQHRQFAENDVHEVEICDMMPQRASMEDPTSQRKNLHHHDCATSDCTEEMCVHQHQFAENKQHVSM
jgi:hypothetical protein